MKPVNGCKKVRVLIISPGGTRVCAVGQPTHPPDHRWLMEEENPPESNLGQDGVALGDMTAHGRRHRDGYYKYYREEKGLQS